MQCSLVAYTSTDITVVQGREETIRPRPSNHQLPMEMTQHCLMMCCHHDIYVIAQDSADLGGGATIFNRLDKYSAGLNSNTKSIAAVLASPLLMEYEVEYARIAGMYGLFFVGVAALCIIAPPLGVGLMAGEIVLASAAGAATLVTGQYIGSKVLTVGAGKQHMSPS